MIGNYTIMKNFLNKTLMITVGLSVIYAFLFRYIDIPIAVWAHSLENTTIFYIAYGLSYSANLYWWKVALAILLIPICLYEYRRGRCDWTVQLLYIVLSIVIAMLVGDSLKYLLGRYRPIAYYEHAQYGFHFLGRIWSENSTPSGHSLRIFALMTALGFVWKPYRWVFLCFALLVGISRVLVHDHYPSDVLFGAYIGVLSAVWTRWFIFCRSANRP